MRPDGTRVKDLPPLVAAIPYIMPKRYDAWNSITENIDEEAVKAYIRHWRREGVRLNHMSVIIAAYYRAVLDNPKLNYFVMNGKIYRRNHFCVSFVILKKRSDGVVNETALKVYLEPSDDIFSIDRKIREVIAANQHEHQSNSTDKFARFMFSVPGLPKFVVWLAYHLDKHGLLPRKIIDLSPLPHQYVHHQSGLHQDQLYPSPLLRVRYHQRVRVHGQARAGLHGRRPDPEGDAHRRGDGRAHLHRI